MEKAAKGDTPEVIAQEIVAEAKEEGKEAPPRLREKLHELEAIWEHTSTPTSRGARSPGPLL